MSGHRDSARKVAAYAVSALYAPDLPRGREEAIAQGTVAWLLAATGQSKLPTGWSRERAAAYLAEAVARPGPGGKLLERMLETKRSNALFDPVPNPALAALPAHPAGALDDEAPEPRTAVVIASIGNPDTAEGKRIREEFAGIIGAPLPVLDLSEPEKVRAALLADYPHAGRVLDRLLPRNGNQPWRFRPVLLVGPPGCGKTSFAIRFAALLGLPTEIVPCGGAADGSLAGTPRRWSTGGPSLPLSLIRSRRHASPAIILDEIEKAACSRMNGSLWEALLGLTDGVTAPAYRDAYAEAPVDLSHVIWIATANSAEEIPRALRDRFQLLRFPAPQKEHLRWLAHRLLVSEAEAKGLDPRWAPPLDQAEAAALAAIWAGGSIRSLERLVSAVARARELGHATA